MRLKKLLTAVLSLYYRLSTQLLFKHVENHRRTHPLSQYPSIQLGEGAVIQNAADRKIPANGKHCLNGECVPVKRPKALLFSRLSGLVSFFRFERSQHVMSAYLSERLKKSVWNHIHTTLMFAHLGQLDKAKIHADICNAALKEVANYMSDEEYALFTKDVKQHLQSIRELGF